MKTLSKYFLMVFILMIQMNSLFSLHSIEDFSIAYEKLTLSEKCILNKFGIGWKRLTRKCYLESLAFFADCLIRGPKNLNKYSNHEEAFYCIVRILNPDKDFLEKFLSEEGSNEIEFPPRPLAHDSSNSLFSLQSLESFARSFKELDEAEFTILDRSDIGRYGCLKLSCYLQAVVVLIERAANMNKTNQWRCLREGFDCLLKILNPDAVFLAVLLEDPSEAISNAKDYLVEARRINSCPVETQPSSQESS